MLFRSKKQTKTVADPVAEAVVSYISNDGYGSAILKTSALYAAIDCIASDVASCRVIADTPTLAKNLSDRNLLFAIVYNMLLKGNAYVAINGNGKFTLIDNSRIELAYDNETNAVKYYVDKKEVPRNKLLHFFSFTKNGAYGISKLYPLRETLKADKALNDLLSSYLTVGLRGTTVIKLPETLTSKESKDKVRQEFDKATSGERAMSSIVIDAGQEVTTLPLNTDALNVIDKVNDIVVRRIAAQFGLPVEKLGVENSHSNVNQSTQASYLKGTLQHIFDCLTREFTDKLGNHNFSFDTSNLISVDPAALQEQAINGYNNGLLTLNEARKMINLDEVPNGNQFKGVMNDDH